MSPIEKWPVVRVGGRGGFSAKHFATLAGAAQDPLRVADRLLAEKSAARLSRESEQRVAAGEDPVAVYRDLPARVAEARAADWERLCASFALVIVTLEAAPQNAVIKRLTREARYAARAS